MYWKENETTTTGHKKSHSGLQILYGTTRKTSTADDRTWNRQLLSLHNAHLRNISEYKHDLKNITDNNISGCVIEHIRNQISKPFHFGGACQICKCGYNHSFISITKQPFTNNDPAAHLIVNHERQRPFSDFQVSAKLQNFSSDANRYRER